MMGERSGTSGGSFSHHLTAVLSALSRKAAHVRSARGSAITYTGCKQPPFEAALLLLLPSRGWR